MGTVRKTYEQLAVERVEQSKADAWALEQATAIRSKAAADFKSNAGATAGLEALGRILYVPKKKGASEGASKKKSGKVAQAEAS